MKIGIQGSQGSYHEAVAQAHYGEEVELDYIDTFKHVFDRLRTQDIGQAVVAIANNRYGQVPEAFNQLIDRSDEVYIVGESYLRVKHQLLGVPGATLEGIKEVHSQAPALGQCNQFLSEFLPHIPYIEQDDTAESARIVGELNDRSIAAIASSQAGRLYGLEPIAEDIQDDKDNITRFLILQRRGDSQPAEFDDGDKTSVLLRTNQTPGALADCLIPLKENDINITQLQQTFVPNTAFEMKFFMEFEAGANDPRTVSALKEIERHQAEVKLLGSYRAAECLTN